MLISINKIFRSIQYFYCSSFSLIVVILFFSTNPLTGQSGNEPKWVGTWSTAPYAAANNTPPAPYLANNTLRQIVRVSIGGDTLHIKFSNRTSPTPVTLNSVNIAISTDSSTSVIDASSIKQLRFKGNESVTMNAYSEVTSDPIAFSLSTGIHLAITIYYGQCETSPDMTFHYGSRIDSYILAGDQSESTDFAGATAIERWYNLNSVDVLTSNESAAVAVLGNSITDGYGLHNGQYKWTDTFSERLLNDSSTSHVSVLNLGIGATWLTSSGVSRFQQDILEQSGLRWIIVFYGVNDIGGNASTDFIINAYKNLIAQAHSQNIRIYGATITPFMGHSYYTPAHEAVRNEVNEWIRTPGNFDRCIDFDKAIRDPSDTARLQAACSNDWLHPNSAGYQFLGESVDLNLFLGADTLFNQQETELFYFEPECGIVGESWDIVSDNQASNEKYVTVKSGRQSLNEPPADSTGVIVISFSVDSAGIYSVYGRMNNASFDDDSYWVKMNNGEFELFNGLVSSGWEWKKFKDYMLTEGEHIFTIGYREDGAKLDKICITNSIISPAGLGKDALNLCGDLTGAIIRSGIPEGYTLGQNYPNPFNPETRTWFTISKTSTVIMKIFDSLGQELQTILNEVKVPGQYEVAINAQDLSSGVYFYQIKAGDFLETKKFIVQK